MLSLLPLLSRICPESCKCKNLVTNYFQVVHQLLIRKVFVFKQKAHYKLLESSLFFENIGNFTAEYLRNKNFFDCETFRMHFRHLNDHVTASFHFTWCTFNYLFSIQIIQVNIKKGKERGKRTKTMYMGHS